MEEVKRECVLLNTTYFGPIQWYQQLNKAERVCIEACESFIKQTYRNRCIIATTNGLQTLSVPIEHNRTANTRKPSPITQTRISNHGNWRHLHWNALASAYGTSPFFDYYVDDLRPFFEKKWENLFDFNLAIIYKMKELLDIDTEIQLTDSFKDIEPLDETAFQPKRYYQVYEQKHGFQPNLSILDLLFNMGNEAILYL